MTARSPSSGNLPGPLEKREILYSEETPAEELTAWGKAFEDAGFPMDALDFYAQARSEKDLERLLAGSIASGDAFVFERCHRALGRRPAAGDEETLVRNAEELGKTAFASRIAKHVVEATGEEKE